MKPLPSKSYMLKAHLSFWKGGGLWMRLWVLGVWGRIMGCGVYGGGVCGKV